MDFPLNRTETFSSRTPARIHQLWRATLQCPYHIFSEFSLMAFWLGAYFLGMLSERWGGDRGCHRVPVPLS